MFTKFKEMIKGVINKLLRKETIKESLKVDVAISNRMAEAIELWCNMHEENSPWLSETVKSSNTASAIADEFARLVTLEFKSEILADEFLNNEYQEVIRNFRNITEFACAKGGIALKPYLNDSHIEVDIIQAENFFPTSYNSRGEITAAIFPEYLIKGDNLYTRLEYHRFENGIYHISNTVYLKKNFNYVLDNSNLGTQISLTEVPEWENIEPEGQIENIKKPLFAYFKIPKANTIDKTSPLGVSVYSKAVKQIEEIDKQYSRILWEFEGTELAIHISKDLLKPKFDNKGNMTSGEIPRGKERLYRKLDIDVASTSAGTKPIETFSPEIRDISLFNGLNKLFRIVEFRVGLAYGTLSDPNDTDKTAEEIKTSKQRSYQTVKEIQNSAQHALKDLVYAMKVWGQLGGLQIQNIDIDKDMSFDWDDSIISDKEHELADMKDDVASGLIRPELYIAKKYGVSEDEARKLMPDTQDLILKDV